MQEPDLPATLSSSKVLGSECRGEPSPNEAQNSRSSTTVTLATFPSELHFLTMSLTTADGPDPQTAL